MPEAICFGRGFYAPKVPKGMMSLGSFWGHYVAIKITCCCGGNFLLWFS